MQPSCIRARDYYQLVTAGARAPTFFRMLRRRASEAGTSTLQRSSHNQFP